MNPNKDAYLILHSPHQGALDKPWQVIRCWHGKDDQQVLFSDQRDVCAGYLASHWDDLDEELPVSSRDKLNIDNDFGTEIFIRTIRTHSMLAMRRALRELNLGTIPIYSDYDCTGLVCGQWAKFLKIYKSEGGYIAVVEITVNRDV